MRLTNSPFTNLLTTTVLLILFFSSFLFTKRELDLFYFINLFKNILFLILYILSSKPRNTTLNPTVLTGIAMSYGGVFLFEIKNPTNSSFILNNLFYFCYFFYSIIIIFALLELGKSFAIFPSLKKLKTGGMYQLVRHPLYSSYIHLFFVFFLVNPNLKNFFSLASILIGLYIRSIQEEQLLKTENLYGSYSKKIKSRFFSLPLSLPMLLVFFIFAFNNTNENSKISLKLNLAYPVVNLNPSVFDDWSSIFISNHIYLPLIPQRDGFSDFAITNNYKLYCANSNQIFNYDLKCKRVALIFNFKNKSGCNGDQLTIKNFKFEINQILSKRNWIFPNFKFCDYKHQINNFCIEFDNSTSVEKNFSNLFLRFGWSKSISGYQAQNFGFGSHCLSYTKKTAEGFIANGYLKSRLPVLPDIEFDDFNKKSHHFDIGIYGESTNNKYSKIETNTPLGFYIVSNPKNGTSLPWFSKNFQKAIYDHLVKYRVIKKDVYQELTNFVPAGNSLVNKTKQRKGVSFQFWIPEFIPDCIQLSNKLRLLSTNTVFSCVNTSVKIAELVVSSNNWDAFITPISPASPDKKSIINQYFNTDSNEAWIKSNSANKYFSLLGLSVSAVDVNINKICGINTSSMGLGDLLSSDFVFCK